MGLNCWYVDLLGEDSTYGRLVRLENQPLYFSGIFITLLRCFIPVTCLSLWRKEFTLSKRLLYTFLTIDPRQIDRSLVKSELRRRKVERKLKSFLDLREEGWIGNKDGGVVWVGKLAEVQQGDGRVTEERTKRIILGRCGSGVGRAGDVLDATGGRK